MIAFTEVLRLSPSVALRPEPFGAMAYHFGNRRLTFLKRPELVAVVNALNGVDSLEEVFHSCGISSQNWNAYARAIDALMDADMIHRVGDSDSPDTSAVAVTI